MAGKKAQKPSAKAKKSLFGGKQAAPFKKGHK